MIDSDMVRVENIPPISSTRRYRHLTYPDFHWVRRGLRYETLAEDIEEDGTLASLLQRQSRIQLQYM